MGAPKRILVVDDEAKILFVLNHALVKLGGGCHILTATNGQEALAIARDTPLDLIITDLRMPGMDGISFTEAVRALDYDPIVIWMTAYDCCTARGQARQLRVHHCMDKPIEICEIRRIVSGALWGDDGPNEAQDREAGHG
jgi:CheY-like chemotaxis protein